MSRIFDALRKSEQDQTQPSGKQPASAVSLCQEAVIEQTPLADDLDRVATITPESTNGFSAETEDVGAETFRVLHHRLELIRRKRPLQKLLITSAIPKEGKTTVACRLAAALGRSRARVLLVDADLRHPGVHRALGIPAQPGVADWLEQRELLPHVLRRVEPYGFFYLPAGDARSNPGELLRQSALGEFLTATAASFDWVVVDSPPLVPFVDAHHLATLVDGVLVVLRKGITPRSAIDQVSTSLERAFVAGAILNGASDTSQGYYRYYGRRRAGRLHAPILAANPTSQAGDTFHD